MFAYIIAEVEYTRTVFSAMLMVYVTLYLDVIT